MAKQFTKADIKSWCLFFGDDEAGISIEPEHDLWKGQVPCGYKEIKIKAIDYLNQNIKKFEKALKRITDETEEDCVQFWLSEMNHKEQGRPQ